MPEPIFVWGVECPTLGDGAAYNKKYASGHERLKNVNPLRLPADNAGDMAIKPGNCGGQRMSGKSKKSAFRRRAR